MEKGRSRPNPPGYLGKIPSPALILFALTGAWGAEGDQPPLQAVTLPVAPAAVEDRGEEVRRVIVDIARDGSLYFVTNHIEPELLGDSPWRFTREVGYKTRKIKLVDVALDSYRCGRIYGKEFKDLEVRWWDLHALIRADKDAPAAHVLWVHDALVFADVPYIHLATKRFADRAYTEEEAESLGVQRKKSKRPKERSLDAKLTLPPPFRVLYKSPPNTHAAQLVVRVIPKRLRKGKWNSKEVQIPSEVRYLVNVLPPAEYRETAGQRAKDGATGAATIDALRKAIMAAHARYRGQKTTDGHRIVVVGSLWCDPRIPYKHLVVALNTLLSVKLDRLELITSHADAKLRELRRLPYPSTPDAK